MLIIKYGTDLITFAWPCNRWMSLNRVLEDQLNAELQIHKEDLAPASFRVGWVDVRGVEALALQKFAERYGAESFELVKYVPAEG